jgi:hypothetical protein
MHVRRHAGSDDFEEEIDGRMQGLANNVRARDPSFSWENIDQRTAEGQDHMDRLDQNLKDDIRTVTWAQETER